MEWIKLENTNQLGNEIKKPLRMGRSRSGKDMTISYKRIQLFSYKIYALALYVFILFSSKKNPMLWTPRFEHIAPEVQVETFSIQLCFHLKYQLSQPLGYSGIN